MNHLYDIATGRLLSSTALDIPNIPQGMAVKASDKTGVWDAEALDFAPIPEQHVISKLDFLDKFADSELEDIIAESNKDTGRGRKVAVFIKRLDLADNIDIKKPRTIESVNGLETLSLIGAGRAAEILL